MSKHVVKNAKQAYDVYRDNNMRQVDTYYGVPIPSQLEVECLQVELFGEAPASLGACIDVADKVRARRPGVADIGSLLVAETADVADDDENGILEAASNEGCRLGFSVGLGVLTYLGYIRETTASGQGLLTVDEYLDSLPKRTSLLPLRKAAQLRRIDNYLEEDVVMSKLILEDADRTVVDLTFTHMAELDYEKYMSKADMLNDVIGSEFRLFGFGVVDRLRLLSGGGDINRYSLVERFVSFCHSGFGTALEIYIQSYVEDQLGLIRKKESLPKRAEIPELIERISGNEDGGIL